MGDGWWVVGRVAIVVATSLPPPTESTTNALPLPSLPYAGSPEAIRRRHLRLSVSAGHNGDEGRWWGCGPEGRKGGVGVILGDVWGGGDARSFSRLLPSLAFPVPPMPSQSFSSSSATSTGHWCSLMYPLLMSSVDTMAHTRGFATHIPPCPYCGVAPTTGHGCLRSASSFIQTAFLPLDECVFVRICISGTQVVDATQPYT